MAGMEGEETPCAADVQHAQEMRGALRLFLIANDLEHRLWPESEVKRAQAAYRRAGGGPPYDGLSQSLGKERLDEILQSIVEERQAELRFHAVLNGHNDPCHSCGGRDGLTGHPFALVRVTKRERDWKPVAISAALTALAFPLIGAGALYGPGKTTSGNLLGMKLILCAACLNNRKGLFGMYMAKERDAALHPLWGDLHGAGFTKFVRFDEISKWL
jgi:hypothetical protein